MDDNQATEQKGMEKLATVAHMVRAAERANTDDHGELDRAADYYNGDMTDTPTDAGRSKVISRDLRDNHKKVMPSLSRILINGEELVEFMPMDDQDEEGAQQSSDYINYVVMPECDGKQAIYDAIFDAGLFRNGILKWWWDEKQTVSISTHTGISQEQYAQLAADDEVEVLESTENVEQIETPEGVIQLPVFDCKLRRTTSKGKICAAAVPRSRFLIHPDSVTLEDSPVVGEKTTITRSDLVAMGYDRDRVNSFALHGEYDEYDAQDRLEDTDDVKAAVERSMQELDYYDLYVRVDMDDDGIAELRHMTFAGGLGEDNLLENEECDEVQFCDVALQRKPHQFEGISLADDLMDVQQIKTVLLRGTMDNLYWQNNPQPIVQPDAIMDMEAVYNPEFGKPIEVKRGANVKEAVGFNQVPFVAENSFNMLGYMDEIAQDRTGISDASSGMAPDALQNMTAKASAMIEAAGIGQTEMMVRTVADGLTRFYKGLLRLSVRHQDKPRTVRLRGEWVDMDPRQWNAGMDCKVNTGLGAGTRERDMMMMQQIMAVQEKLLAGFGPDNPFVKPDNVYNVISKLSESAGLRNVQAYFTKPDEQEVQAKLEKMRNAPNPEQMKLEAQMKLEQAKMATNRDKEQAQMQADLQVKQAEITAKAQETADTLKANAALAQQQLMFDREKTSQQIQLERDRMAQDLEVKLMELQAKRQDADQKRQDDIDRSHAEAFRTAAE